MINDWAREYFQATGYITPFDPIAYADTKTLRSRLGYDPDQPLILAAVGGTHAGRHLLAKTIDSWSLLQEALPEARCVIVTGPRIDPAELPEAVNLDVRHYVHDLYEHIAAADLVITQGGLGTTMECVVTRRPFLYFPLKNHCEQVYHVTHRLQRHMAGRQMDYHNTAAEIMADAIVAVLSSDTAAYRLPDPSAAGRAAGMIAELL